MLPFREASYYREVFPSVAALILIAPSGSSFLHKLGSPLPKGRFRLLGLID